MTFTDVNISINFYLKEKEGQRSKAKVKQTISHYLDDNLIHKGSYINDIIGVVDFILQYTSQTINNCDNSVREKYKTQPEISQSPITFHN